MSRLKKVWLDGVGHFTSSGWCYRATGGILGSRYQLLPASASRRVLKDHDYAPTYGGTGAFERFAHQSIALSLADGITRPELEDEYVDAFFPGTRRSNSHAVIEFSAGKQRILIPAHLLITELLLPSRRLDRFIFAPQGIDNLAMRSGEGADGVTMLAPKSAYSDGGTNTPQRLSWIVRSPSARRSWDSVLRFALGAGAISLDLPDAEATVALYAGMRGDTHYVFRCDLKTLRPLDVAGEGIASPVLRGRCGFGESISLGKPGNN